ncbi:energy-coupling factor transporter ATP-binding protein EcfA2 [Kitasatospora sp. MAA4]|uniref:hypothetical protein n=1 Tax=Kitasatospora sp. MAA4 TaxID=3035093 RepID=UPI00247505B1|nr:hypothetical protein [Kitasatospora sp. MAA4]MDH6132431.1 energy-coupling factor transporter ATP-binding protein EcfA2 [Kitasatospora sp. MAA4]
MTRLALYGRPGVGKSTFTSLLAEALTERGRVVVTLKVGALLYRLQESVYVESGLPAPPPGRQDGQLLNTLGAHVRRINPTALVDDFALQVKRAMAASPNAVILCDDVRAPDVDALHVLGFSFVQVVAPESLRRVRKASRGDLSPGDENHATEAEPGIVPDHRIGNAGTLSDLRDRAGVFAEAVIR